jgi:thiamine biosynthesis lipoprotein
MGTVVSVTVITPDEEAGRAAIEAAFEEIARVESLTTRYAGGSEISDLNAMEEGYVGEPVGPEVTEIVARSLEIARESEGAFDITVAPLVELWPLTRDDFAVPDEAAVEEALWSVDWQAVQVDTAAGTMTALPGIAVDLDGVAKGYAVDRATAVLGRMGIETGVVDAGGDVGFVGTPPNSEHWRVGIKHPRGEGLLGVAHLDASSVATSGDYQRYAVIDGVRYHHILDPSTGRPARGVMSVTVSTDRCVDADALATAVFVLGRERGMALVERMPGVEAVMVTADGDAVGEVLLSSGLAGRFEEGE